MGLDFPDLLNLHLATLVVSGWWMLQRNDELPLIISAFVCYISSYRYWIVTSGKASWVNISNFGFESITNQSALGALQYIILGHICLLAAYMMTQKRILPVIKPKIDHHFLNWLRPKMLFLGLLCLPLVVISRNNVNAQVSSGRSVAFEVSSYLYLFPMVLVGVATLLLCVWRFGGLPTLMNKGLTVLLLIGVSYLTYSPNARFQFLAWIIAGGVVLSSSYKPRTRLLLFVCTGVLALGLFALAGAQRNDQLTGDTLNNAAIERAYIAEDANMLDGFVLMQQVYPKRLEFTFGMEHIEILLRPIPRALWPEKPVGGYMNKLGLLTAGRGTLGISQSLFGSFYGEGGLEGILIFSVLYGIIFAKIVDYSTTLQPFASIIVRAILCACLIPLLRGGDLPGIYAWFGMAFWPCFLLLWIKRHELKLPILKKTPTLPNTQT
jgi:hypothetical protein